MEHGRVVTMRTRTSTRHDKLHDYPEFDHAESDDGESEKGEIHGIIARARCGAVIISTGPAHARNPTA